MPAALAEDVEQAALESGLSLLPTPFAHVQRTGLLPRFHKDPFDRLLIAQAMVEGLTLISVDEKFDQYGVDRVC